MPTGHIEVYLNGVDLLCVGVLDEVEEAVDCDVPLNLARGQGLAGRDIDSAREYSVGHCQPDAVFPEGTKADSADVVGVVGEPRGLPDRPLLSQLVDFWAGRVSAG